LANKSDNLKPNFTDPKNFPFFYHLGKVSGAKSLAHIDVDLGLEDVCFIQGSKQFDRWMGYASTIYETKSAKLTWSNVGKFCKNIDRCTELKDFDKFILKKYDAIILSNPAHIEPFRDIIWENLSRDGILIINKLNDNKKGFSMLEDFSKSVNRKPEIFKTRYGTGIIER